MALALALRGGGFDWFVATGVFDGWPKKMGSGIFGGEVMDREDCG